MLDTSVAVAWYLPEEFSAEAKKWRDEMSSGRVRLLVPGLHYWEFANVLRTYAGRGEVDEDLALDIYRTHLKAPLETAEPDREHVLATALAYRATAYDAVFIALALERKIPLLTAEKTTSPWMVKLGRLAEAVGPGR